MSARPLRLVGTALLVEGALVVGAVAGGSLLNVHPLAAATPSWAALTTGVVATLPLLLGLAWSVRTRLPPLARLARDVEERILPLFQGCSPAHLAAIALFAGVGEELFFRGLLQAAAAEWLSPGIALLLASAAFGLAHPITPLYAVLAGIVGLYLGALFLVTESLVAPTVAHGLYDFVALMYVTGRGARSAPQGAR